MIGEFILRETLELAERECWQLHKEEIRLTKDQKQRSKIVKEKMNMDRERYIHLHVLAKSTLDWLEKQGLKEEELPEFYLILLKMSDCKKEEETKEIKLKK